MIHDLYVCASHVRLMDWSADFWIALGLLGAVFLAALLTPD